MSNREFFTDRTGKWVGSVTTESNGRKTYFDAKGAFAGRVSDNKTYDNKGRYFGNGDQGKRLFGK
jgi:hypothetical protein